MSDSRQTDPKFPPMTIENPLVIMFEVEQGIQCSIHRPDGWTHHHYGLIVCDLVRHVASAFGVSEDAVWEWVDKERYHHTTDIQRPS